MSETLKLLDQGAIDAEAALEDLRALWKREDEATAARRAHLLEAHEQGNRDRERARAALMPPQPVEDARMSSLPVTPVKALSDA